MNFSKFHNTLSGGIMDVLWADRYKSQYTYDANGNIETAARFDGDGNMYDAMTYGHHVDANGRTLPQPALGCPREAIAGSRRSGPACGWPVRPECPALDPPMPPSRRSGINARPYRLPALGLPQMSRVCRVPGL